ncbi:MAG: alanine racemase [Lachnospiraceae bacterium]
MRQYDRVWADINLDHIQYNMEQMKENIAENTKIMAVIKTDGYGHGAVPLAKELETLPYLYGFATATVEEASILRRSGINHPILILGYTFPYCYEKLVQEELCPTVFQYQTAKQLSEVAVRLNKVLKIHIAVDTGMSRIGIMPNDTGLAFLQEIVQLPNLLIEGIFTHFARADEADKSYARVQLHRFQAFIQKAESSLRIQIPIKHCSNSAGIVTLPEANMDVVRAGITLYGLWPSNEVSKKIISLQPVLSLHSHIVYVKTVAKGVPISYGGTYVSKHQMQVATIPVGYGDGYPRGLSNTGYVLIRGQEAPIIGRICMDQFMVDVTAISGAAEGDEVTLIGTDGDKTITMEELGDLSGRFNYELACDLGKRIPRIYSKNGKVIRTKDYNDDI